MKILPNNKNAGFTLIELLVVITVIGILAAGAFVALNPAKRFADSRDATRWTDISAILDAAKVDQVDSAGAYTAAIAAMVADNYYMIGTDSGANCDNVTPCDVTIDDDGVNNYCVNISQLATDGYLAAVPVSPNGTGTWDAAETGYYMVRNANGSLTVGACEGENATIEVKR
ncbi:type II secretion system protein [candidate division WWE3 bacterium]|uniref:Type II secretion system protein n=1 Tax=candidate division WWE3 bacterium TaxID=2053526 RepID=A0A955RQU0_UNCKA|nr:type II secretion system protein [candidate division WWE3 bacterium]